MHLTQAVRAGATRATSRRRQGAASAAPSVPTRLAWVPRPALMATGLLSVAGGVLLLEGPSVLAGTLLWLLGLGLLAGSCWGPPATSARPTASITRAEAWALGALTVGGLWLRVWAPEAFPSGVHSDEAAMGLVARDILQGRGPHPFGFAFISDPAPLMYAEAAFMSVLGVGIGAIRTMAGLASALMLPALWLLARPLFGARVALLAVGLLAFSAAHLHFSRIAIASPRPALFGLLALALAWRGVHQGRPIWHLLAGVALGLAQYVHFGARSFAIILAGTYLVFLLARPGSWRAIVGGGLLAGLGAVATLAPQLAHVRDDPGILVDRAEFRSVFRRWDQATEIHGTTDPLGVMLGQVRTNLLAFVNVPDRGPFFEFAREPLLFAPIGILFLLGLLLALARLRDPRFAILLLSCAVVLAGGVFSAGSPQFHRLTPMLPVACLLAAVAADRAAGWLANLLNYVPRRVAPVAWATPARLSAALLGGLLALTAVDGVSALFVRHPAEHPWQPQTAWSHWVAAQPADHAVLLAGAPDVYAWDQRIRLRAGAEVPRDLPNPSADLPAARAEGRPLVVALNPKLDDWLPLFGDLLPDARMETVPGPRGEPLLFALYVPPVPPPSLEPSGLRGELAFDGDGEAVIQSRADATLAFREASKLSGGEPFRASWTGQLLVETAGEYRLELYTDGQAELVLDGRAIIQGRASPQPRSLRADLHLAPGPHSLVVRYGYIRGLGTFELRWRPPGTARVVIPPGALRPL